MRHHGELKKTEDRNVLMCVCVFTYSMGFKTQNGHTQKWWRYYALNPQKCYLYTTRRRHITFSAVSGGFCADFQSIICLSCTGTGHKTTAMGTPVHRAVAHGSSSLPSFCIRRPLKKSNLPFCLKTLETVFCSKKGQVYIYVH